MAAPYNAQNDLNVYLQTLERRMQSLEFENQQLRETIKHPGNNNAYALMQALPRTGLLSQSFMTRAFAVWGHYFVAQLVISLILFLIYLAIMAVILVIGGGLISNF